MSIVVPLIILSALITLHHWATESRQLESTAVESPARFLYASTTLRRLSVTLGFCFLVLVVVGGGAVGVYSAVSNFGPSLPEGNWALRTALLSAIAGGIFLLFASSPLRPLVDRLRCFFLRHLFFPSLPSYREEQVLKQLVSARAASGELSAERDGTEKHGESGGSQGQGVQRGFDELSRLHGKLEKTVGRNKLSHTLFRKEWEMFDSIYRSLREQMASSTLESSADLGDKTRSCLYCSYRLMIGHVFVTGFTRKQQLRQFRWFGYRVMLPEDKNGRPPAVVAHS